MNKTDLINSFAELGENLKQIPESTLQLAKTKNQWFTIDFIKLAANNWAKALTHDNIEKWLTDETFEPNQKNVGVIMAGNIPFVGLHDLLSILAQGMNAQVKLSSNDEVLMKYCIDILTTIQPEFASMITSDGKFVNLSYLIATGSNNSARYFEYYFKNTSTLIRKNRTSLAVLSGKESEQELELLANDIYTYFGLGCRNVTHLILPRNFELKPLYEAYDKYMDHVHHHKYYNNYIYHKSI
ncbi:MAG: acyl-CoA reductase, partial [Bacteroidia bacterium]